MGKVYPEIDEKMKAWVEKQKLFFVATAPLAGDGMVNCSPKGMDSFRMLGPRTVGYLDLTGSGVETIAHLKENQRMVIMMCAFEGPPNIVRFHGKGRVFERGSEEYAARIDRYEAYPGARAIIEVEVERISDSCGYSVPYYDYQGERDILLKWANAKGEEGVRDYQKKNNTQSLDGLEGIG